MRILQLYADAFRPDGPPHLYLTPGLAAAGHEVVALDPGVLAEVFGWDGAQRQVVRWCDFLRPHLILVYPPYHLTTPATIAACRALGARWVALRYDDAIWLSFAQDRPDPSLPRGEHPGPAMAALQGDNRLWDLTLTTSRAAARLLTALGDPIVYDRLPVCVESYLPPPGRRRKAFAFVGSHRPTRTGYREQVLQQVLAAGLPLELWGHGWQDVPALKGAWRGPASHREMLGALGNTLGALSLPSLTGERPVAMIKGRLLETTACGGLCLTDACEELPEYFTVGTEVLAYTDADSLIATMRSLLERPDWAQAAGAAARARTIRDHGAGPWLHRVLRLLEDRGLTLHGNQPDPRSPLREPLGESLVAVASVLEQAAHRSTALALYERAAALMPSDSGALGGLMRLGDPDTATAAAQTQVRHALPRPFVMPRLAQTDLPTVGRHPGAPGLEAGARLLSDNVAGSPELWRQAFRLYRYNSPDLSWLALTRLAALDPESADLQAAWEAVWGPRNP